MRRDKVRRGGLRDEQDIYAYARVVRSTTGCLARGDIFAPFDRIYQSTNYFLSVLSCKLTVVNGLYELCSSYLIQKRSRHCPRFKSGEAGATAATLLGLRPGRLSTYGAI